MIFFFLFFQTFLMIFFLFSSSFEREGMAKYFLFLFFFTLCYRFFGLVPLTFSLWLYACLVDV